MGLGFEFDCKQRISTTTNRVIGELEIFEPGNDYFFWRVSRSHEKKENFINKSLLSLTVFQIYGHLQMETKKRRRVKK